MIYNTFNLFFHSVGFSFILFILSLKRILKNFKAIFFYCKQIHVRVQIKLQIRGLDRQQFNYQIFQKF